MFGHDRGYLELSLVIANVFHKGALDWRSKFVVHGLRGDTNLLFVELRAVGWVLLLEIGNKITINGNKTTIILKIRLLH